MSVIETLRAAAALRGSVIRYRAAADRFEAVEKRLHAKGKHEAAAEAAGWAFWARRALEAEAADPEVLTPDERAACEAW